MQTRVYHKDPAHSHSSRLLYLVLENVDNYLVIADASARVYAVSKKDYQLTEPTEGDDLV